MRTGLLAPILFLLWLPTGLGQAPARKRLSNKLPAPLSDAANYPKGTVGRILKLPRFAPLVRSRTPAWKSQLKQSLDELNKIKLRPIRVKKPKTTPPPPRSSSSWKFWRPRLPRFRLPRIPLPSLPSMPPWLSTFLRGTGYVMLLGLIVFATILLELLVAYQLARIFKLDIAPRLLTLLKKLTPFIAGSGNQASPGKSAVNIKRRTRSTERLELEQRTPRGWKAHAIELMAAGRGQDALRALYLALLARLDRQGLIRYDPSKTNWQYRMQLPAGTIRDAFSELSRIFDRTWYGSYPCDASAFHRGSILVDQVLRETDR